MKYSVHVQLDWVYSVDADDPDEIEAMFSEGDISDSDGECTGYSITAVTTPDDYFGNVDLRSPKPCRGCGKSLPAAGFDICTPCVLGGKALSKGMTS